MADSIYYFFERLDAIFWGYLAFTVIMALGLYFTVKSRFMQIRAIPQIFRTFASAFTRKDKEDAGVHPVKILFASVGSMVGVGNLVGIVTAVQIGGPGALFWAWIAALLGSIIKYSEVFLGLKHRVRNERGGYDGGPMQYLFQAFRKSWIPKVVALLLCIYGVEIYQFNVVTESIADNWEVHKGIVVAIFLGLIAYVGWGEVKRVAHVSSYLLPIFMVLYIGMALWVVGHHAADILSLFGLVIKSAFTGHAAVGGFVGGSMILAVQHGLARAAYSADIGIGNDAVIHSESRTVEPALQARLALFGVFLDALVCTLSLLVVLLTGVWSAKGVPASQLVQEALGQYFPFMSVFMPLFFLILGYTTLTAFFAVGLKAARFLMPKAGKKVYLSYALLILPLFSFADQSSALLVMSLLQAALLLINLTGIYFLRKEVVFSLGEEEQTASKAVPKSA